MREIGWLVGDTTRPYQYPVEVGYLTTRFATQMDPKSNSRVLKDPQLRITPRGIFELHVRLSAREEGRSIADQRRLSLHYLPAPELLAEMDRK
jgi:hypothetical protein